MIKMLLLDMFLSTFLLQPHNESMINVQLLGGWFFSVAAEICCYDKTPTV